MKHILVPTNFLDYAQNAADYAVQMAKEYDARITLFHTYHIPVVDPLIPSEYLSELAESAEKAAVSHIETELERLKENQDAADVNIDYHVAMGFAADEILSVSQTLGVDTIIVGTRHRDTLQRILSGSVLGIIVDKAQVPVMVIPLGVSYKPINNALFASEYNDSEDLKSIDKALDFVGKVKANLYSVHVQEREPDENDLGRLDGIREIFKNEIASGKLHFDNIYEGNVIHALTEYSHHNNIDVTIMVTHKRSFFERIFDRSLSKEMAYRTDLPLVVFHK